jgi:hypothetical protein
MRVKLQLVLYRDDGQEERGSRSNRAIMTVISLLLACYRDSLLAGGIAV